VDWIEQSLTPHPTQYRSFRRRSSQPITWLLAYCTLMWNQRYR